MKFSFAAKLFAPKANPIGVDFGTDTLRIAQVQWQGNEPRLIAAASVDLPDDARHDMPGRLAFFVRAVRDLLANGGFRGRAAVLSLPISQTYIQHLRLMRMDEEATRKALPWEARGKLPLDPSQALLRHLVAGEVYQEQEARNEIILMAAAREGVDRYLAAAAKARLDVVGMNVEPLALLDCVGHAHRRRNDREQTVCVVDIGACGSRAYIVREGRLLFARAIAIGGDHFSRAVADELKLSLDEARMLRGKLAGMEATADPVTGPAAQQGGPMANEGSPMAPDVAGSGVGVVDRRKATELGVAAAQCGAAGPADGEQNSFALLGAALSAARAQEGQAEPAAARLAPASAPQTLHVSDQALLVRRACGPVVQRLVAELNLCRRYYESTWPTAPVQRLLFVGGEARHREVCVEIARRIGLAAQVLDPVARLSHGAELSPESGIDRRVPQPAWALAIGLSLGPVAAEAAA